MSRWGPCCLALTLLACSAEDGAEDGAPILGMELSVELGARDLAQLGATGAARDYDLLLVTLDTVRADRLGCTGHAGASTPTIDALASRGVRFEHAIASAPVTLPSHASLLTGLDPIDHGVRNNGTYSLEKSRETLAETLTAAGYRAAAFIGAYVLDARYGLNQGFEHYDDDVNPQHTGRVSGHYNERNAAQVTDAAIEWLRQEAPTAEGKPLFTWVHYFDAHGPYEPPGEFARRFKRNPYDGEIAFMDSQLARLLEQLESSGRLATTLVVITSDHGEGLAEHGEDTHTRLLYDSTLRVPLILSNASLFQRPIVVKDRVASLTDVAPTLLDLLGVEVPAVVTGLHLFQAVPDDSRAVYVETMVPLLNHGWAPLQGFHRLRDKFISAPRLEYYDLVADREEHNNLYPSPPAAAQELRAALGRRLEGQASPADFVSSEAALDPESARRLAALGYTRGSSGGALGQLDPKDMMPVWKAMSEASALSSSGQQAAGLRKIEVVLSKHPQDAYALELASLIYGRMGRQVEAERALQKCLRLAPTAEGFVRLAQFQLARQSLVEMEEALAKAAALDPREGGVYMVSGDAYALQGRWTEALAAFERALRIDPVKWGKDAQIKLQQVKARM